jgi:hypothetical protein
MLYMPLGLNLLLVMAVLVLFGAATKMLERMHIKRYVILLFILAAFGGCLIPSIQITDSFLFNIGGSIIPLAFFIFLLIKVRGAKDKIWTIAAALIAATGIFVLDKLFIQEVDTSDIIEPMYISAIFSGILANLLCRNYKSILANSIFSIMGAGAITFIEENAINGFAYLNFGSATQFDCLVLSVFSSMVIARAVLLVRQIWYKQMAKTFERKFPVISEETPMEQNKKRDEM